MLITYAQWEEEIDRIKQDNGFQYLTKKRCRQLYGWSWSMQKYWNVSPNRYMVKVTFYTLASESFYRLKWI